MLRPVLAHQGLLQRTVPDAIHLMVAVVVLCARRNFFRRNGRRLLNGSALGEVMKLHDYVNGRVSTDVRIELGDVFAD